MRHSAPPPAMNTYRPRPVEVQAIDCGDGRYVLLTEPPRYMPTPEFEAAFEPMNGRRPRANHRPAARAKRGKRAAAQRKAPKHAPASAESTSTEGSPGRGRKLCPQCHQTNPASVKRCQHCMESFG
jgi:hypothetical protein